MLKDIDYSDLHITPEGYFLKAQGRVSVLPDHAADDAQVLKDLANKHEDASFALSHEGCRFRVIRSNSILGPVYVLRRVDQVPLGWGRLGFPNAVFPALFSAERRGGLIIFAGETDSGKSTSARALLTAILEQQPYSACTIEDPVEVLLPTSYQSGAICSQIEVRRGQFAEALRDAYRMNNNVILVGEIRDTDAAYTALEAALAGAYVITTTHASHGPGALSKFARLLPHCTEDLAQAFHACIWQKLTYSGGIVNRTLQAAYLFSCPPVRAKIANGQFNQLANDVELQGGRIKNNMPPL